MDIDTIKKETEEFLSFRENASLTSSSIDDIIKEIKDQRHIYSLNNAAINLKFENFQSFMITYFFTKEGIYTLFDRFQDWVVMDAPEAKDYSPSAKTWLDSKKAQEYSFYAGLGGFGLILANAAFAGNNVLAMAGGAIAVLGGIALTAYGIKTDKLASDNDEAREYISDLASFCATTEWFTETKYNLAYLLNDFLDLQRSLIDMLSKTGLEYTPFVNELKKEQKVLTAYSEKYGKISNAVKNSKKKIFPPFGEYIFKEKMYALEKIALHRSNRDRWDADIDAFMGKQEYGKLLQIE
jgi:hypothetical protein